MKGQDWLGDTINLLRHESKEVYGYYSVIFNNNAFINHPEWRITPRPPLLGGAFHGRRYGQVCPNHPEYRRFVEAQLEDLFAPSLT